MRFRLLFIVFNVVIVVSFLLIFLMPALVLGWEYTGVFWGANWPIGIAFVGVLLGLNAYFIANWRLFTLLEQEDWSGAVAYLEPRVFAGKGAGVVRTRVLVNAYLMTGSPERVGDLAEHLRTHRPRTADRLALELTTPRLLGGAGESLVPELKEATESGRVAKPTWIRWCYAVSLLMGSRLDEARDELVVVTTEAREPLLLVLAASMLSPYADRDDEVREATDAARARIREKYSRDRLERLLERERQSLHIVLLASQIQTGITWAFPEGGE